jgi:hypothetical protein
MIDRPRKTRREICLRTLRFWQGLLRVVGSFGDCPRCLAVCPVGNDYHAHLADVQKVIPEKTPEKWRSEAVQGSARPRSGRQLGGL